ncbi:MAG: DUF86 domain-containing protein [Mobilicoccus sp.]|nr:DUF86 domain-containing protein [Mobilicoccus sp.]
MVDVVRVERLLRQITDDIAVLEREARADDSRRADPMWLRGVKYSLITAIESCVDIAQHVCATSGWGPPADNGHALRLLGEHGYLPPDLAEALARASGFRNVLVHDYVRVKDDIVLRRLTDLSDLRRFVATVASHLWATS